MHRVEIFKVQVHFGDCDPAGIVFYPNFFRWFDAASRHYFDRCGLPSWRETEQRDGIIGTPLVESSSRFLLPASYGDLLEIHTSIVDWSNKVFTQHHGVFRDGELLASGEEKRVFVCRDGATGRLRAVPVPPDIRERCRNSSQ